LVETYPQWQPPLMVIFFPSVEDMVLFSSLP
jgi:hypothetical protein